MSLSRPKFQPAECLAEANFYDEKSLPKMGATTVMLAPLILEVPLFSVSRSVSTDTVDATWHRAGRGSVRYRGRTLTQSHETLFLTLIHVRAGQPVGNVIEFYPHELLEKMGWSDNSRNTARLAALIEDLFDARLDMWAEGQQQADGWAIRFIAEKHTPQARGARWSINLADKVLGLFKGHLSYINIRKRGELREGLATFLYGYICANDCKVPLSFETLYIASGSETRLADFVGKARKALDTLKAHGCIADYKDLGKTVRVYK